MISKLAGGRASSRLRPALAAALIAGAVLLGRAPAARAGEADASLPPSAIPDEIPAHRPIGTRRFPFLAGSKFAGRGLRTPAIPPAAMLFSLNKPDDLKEFQEWLGDYLRRHPEAAAMDFSPELIQRMEQDLRANPKYGQLYRRMKRLETVFGMRPDPRRPGGKRPPWAQHVMEWAQAEIASDPSLLNDPNLAEMAKRLERRIREPGVLGASRRSTFIERFLNPESPDSPFSADSWLGQQGEDLLERMAQAIQNASGKVSQSAGGELASMLRRMVASLPGLGSAEGSAAEAGAAGGGGGSALGTAATVLLLAVSAVFLVVFARRLRPFARRAEAPFPRPPAGRPIRSRAELVEAFLALSAYALQREFPPLTHVEIEAQAAARHPRASPSFRALSRLFELAFYHPDPARVGEAELSGARQAYRAALEAVR